MHWGKLKAVPDPSLLFIQDKGFKVISRYSLGVTMCGDQCQLDLLWRPFHYMNINIKSLRCVPQTNIMIYVNYI